MAKKTNLPSVCFGTGDEGGQRLLVVEIEQVRDRAALGGAPAFGQLIGLELIDLAGAGEKQQPVVSRDRDQLLDEIFLAGGRADLAAAAAPLRAIERKRSALDIAAVRDGDQHVFFDDQIFDREIAFGLDYLGAARIAEFLLQLRDVRGDELHQLLLVGEDLLEPRDRLRSLLVLGFDLVALQRGQPAQSQIQDRLGLDLRELEARHQIGARALGVLGGADQLDHRVEVAQRDHQPFQHVQARLGLAQLELRAARDHALAMLQKVHQHLAQAQFARAALVDRQHVQPVALLHRRQLVELVEHDFRLGVALELDHDPHPVAVRLVAQVADTPSIRFSLTSSAIRSISRVLFTW